MKPTAETAEALSLLGENVDVDLLQEFRFVADRVRTLVPQCWGMSLSFLHEGVTFTAVASEHTVAQLDGVQYAASGPCVDAVLSGEEISTTDLSDPLNEERWREFATVGAASGVASTLSLPLRADGAIVGGYNFYADTPHAFGRHVRALAVLVNSRPVEAVTNADMTFASRASAARAPGELRDQALLEQATGYLAASQAIPPDEARERLLKAAGQAGLPPIELARTIMQRRTG
jgi:hypothetical protein